MNPSATQTVSDQLQPLPLTASDLSGEIGRRIRQHVSANFLAIDLEKDFIAPFRLRPFKAGQWHYVGVGKVIDAGARFAAFAGDPKVAERTTHLIDAVIATRDADGYIGAFPVEPEGRQNHHNWVLHDQEYLLLGLTHDYQRTGNPARLEDARQLADYIMATFPKDPRPEEVCTAGLPEAFLALYATTANRRLLEFAATPRHGNAGAELQCASLREWRQTFDQRPAHIYCMLARVYAQTVLYRYDGERSLLHVSDYMRREFFGSGASLNVAGSTSDGEHASYTQNGAGAIGESCVTAYLLRWMHSLMRLDGDLRWGDVMERTIHNALFAAQSPDGRQIRYFTPLTGPRAYFDRDGYCCPGNYRRILGELPSYVYFLGADGALNVNLFTPSRVTIPDGNGGCFTAAW